MRAILSAALITILAISISSCIKEQEGCTNPMACNYDSEAEKDDGSCYYGCSEGCTNTCPYAYDGECDDGSPGSVTSICDTGTDCADCGNSGGGGGGNSGYDCISGDCEYTSSGATYSSLSTCESNCGGGSTSGYDCVSGDCDYVSSGATYASLSACENNCGGGGGPGNVMFWIETGGINGCGNISVTIPGHGTETISVQISYPWDCGISGCANFTLPEGNYTYQASCTNLSWSNSFNLSDGECKDIELN